MHFSDIIVLRAGKLESTSGTVIMSVMMTGLAEVIPTLVVSVVAMLCEPLGTAVRAVVPVATRLVVGGSK
jgi:hypothetical protein